jgi:hypothetical protein
MAIPDNKNFLGQTGFRLVLDRIPTVSYFSQSASIPPVSIGTSNQTNPFTDIPLAGEKITYSPFNLTFRVDEDMINYLEIYNWLVGLGSPENFDQYKNFQQRSRNQRNVSDATLSILSSKYNPNLRVKFQNMFPESLSELTFSTTATDIDYLEATVTFRYTLYTIESV